MDSSKLANKIRNHCVDMTHLSGASHIGAMLSVADIIAVLYSEVIQIDPKNPKAPNRDRVILSKGHSGAVIYSALAELGFFDVKELDTYYQDGSKLSGHVSHKSVPGVELSTGSLGHGISVATGMALAGKINKSRHRIYVVMGDGECEEGSTWEAALFASHQKLDNLVVIVDNNNMQAMGYCDEQMGMVDIANKWKEFGFHTIECDGHDYNALKSAICGKKEGKPLCVVAHTIKGKGVSFMENQILWHYRDPQGEFYEQAKEELKVKQ